MRLFTERAGAAAPGFALDEENAADVARICFRLDGLPLALELAAGRVGALSPGAIAERLGDRFRVLRTVSRAAPTRQQTLTATLQWSHDLLEPDERALFRRLAAFAGGFELEAVEEVCAAATSMLPASPMSSHGLVEKSLVSADQASSRDRRYLLLETVRLYARERLDEAGEASALADRHARWALALAEAERGSPRLDRDAANLRLALDTLLDGHPPDEALRFCVALWPFWMRRIDLDEARRRYQEALRRAPERTVLRAQALHAAATIDFRSGTLPQGLVLAEESCAVASEVGDAEAEWRALQLLGEFGVAIDAAGIAMPWLERALELARREGFGAREAICVYSLGVANWILGDLARAEVLVARSIDLLRALRRHRRAHPVAGQHRRVRTPRRRQDRPAPRLRGHAAAVPRALPRRGRQLRPRQSGRHRAHVRRPCPGRPAARRERGTVRGRRRRAGHGGGARPARLSGARPGRPSRRPRSAGGGARPPARRRATGAASDSYSPGSAWSRRWPATTTRADRHLGEARDIFRRAGDRWGVASSLWRTADLAFARDDLDDAEAALEEARAVLGATAPRALDREHGGRARRGRGAAR